jgi:threonine dehydrogenase-like Zn-dependent dehydrogenase
MMSMLKKSVRRYHARAARISLLGENHERGNSGAHMSQQNTMDCLIIGGGPAGLTAAIYLARYRRDVLVIDAGQSRARLIPETHNYPGFAEGVAGSDLLANPDGRRNRAIAVCGRI